METILNDKDRSEWVNNNEPLYRWWKAERNTQGKHMSLRNFVTLHRQELTDFIHHEQHKYDGRGGTLCHRNCPYYGRG